MNLHVHSAHVWSVLDPFLKGGGGGGGCCCVTVLLVYPGWPPDVSLFSTWVGVCCWCHVLPCLLSVPSHLVTSPLFQFLQCPPRYLRLSPYLSSRSLWSCADPCLSPCVVTVQQSSACLPACLPVFPLRVFFVNLCLFYY